ncbi:MAG: amidohydrolase family protein [Bryobacterales bacterium]|nr:amidohydrolase family protein [Bryobacterales bacterium]
MNSPLLIRGARQLVTMRGSPSGAAPGLGIIPDGVLLIRNGRIEQVGASRRVLNLSGARGSAELDATGCLVMPGFVDADADLFGDAPTRVSLRKSVERLIEHGTTAVSCPAPGRRTLKLLEECDPPITIQLRTEQPQTWLRPLHDLVRNQGTAGDVPPNTPTVIASGFHPQRSPACNLQTAASLMVLNGGTTIEAALCAITTQAAQATGLALETGSLEPGKFADLLLLDVPDYREIPYHFGVNLVRAVMRRGQVIYSRGEFEWHAD